MAIPDSTTKLLVIGAKCKVSQIFGMYRQPETARESVGFRVSCFPVSNLEDRRSGRHLNYDLGLVYGGKVTLLSWTSSESV